MDRFFPAAVQNAAKSCFPHSRARRPPWPPCPAVRASGDIPALEHAGGRAVPHPVEVGFLPAGQAGMKPGRRLRKRRRADILRQIVPQGLQDLLTGQLRVPPEGNHLFPGVDSRVRPAGGGRFHRLGQGPAEHRLHLPLDGGPRYSPGAPAPVSRPVVAQGQAKIPPAYPSCTFLKGKIPVFPSLHHNLFTNPGELFTQYSPFTAPGAYNSLTGQAEGSSRRFGASS